MTDIQKAQVDKLRSEGFGYGKIAQVLGISPNTVKSYCRRNKISSVEVKSGTIAAETSEQRTTYCECCGKEFQQKQGRKRKRFCCDSCRNKWWNSHLHLVNRKAVYSYRCPVCGRTFEVYGNSYRKYCSHECYIEARFRRRSE